MTRDSYRLADSKLSRKVSMPRAQPSASSAATRASWTAAVMRTLVERYGVAPRAFLVAPLVGAFFIDFTNALIITGFINFWH